MNEHLPSAPDGSAGSRRAPGKLKIFFGYAPGVGKTYAMLEAALRARDGGVDVICGYMDPGIPPETARLLSGLERLPEKAISSTVREFDLDAALARRPQLILVDVLAHVNAPGCRHVNRYQDVQELLRAGIDVYSTLNVQDLESLSDVTEAVTGSVPHQHVPDSVFDSASQVEVVDLEPADLLERLHGIYGRKGQSLPFSGGQVTEKALDALREIALRRTADRLERIPGGRSGEEKPRAGEHIMICLSGAPSNPKVIRTAARLADAFHGTFTALFVEPPDFRRQDEARQLSVRANLRLAEELGARIATAYGNEPAIQIAEYARVSGVTKIVLGRSPQRFWSPHAKSLVDQLNTLAPDLDIYIIPDHPAPSPYSLSRRPGLSHGKFSLKNIFRMLAVLALCSGIGFLFRHLGFNNANIIMIYILGVLAIAMVTEGRRYSLLSSVLSVLIFNFFFTYPYFSLISDPSYLVTFAVMFMVAFLGSSLTTRVKQQAAQSAEKAYRTEILQQTSQKLQKAEDFRSIIAVTATQLNRLLERDLVIYPIAGDGSPLAPLPFPVRPGGDLSACLTPEERSAAAWVAKNNKHAGATTSTLPDAKCLYMAIRGSAQVEAVAGIAIRHDQKPDAFEKNLMIAILDECGLALEKERVVQAKRQAEEAARQEALRANLLRAISHDLRTPLTSISGNAGILMDKGILLDEEKKNQLYGSIYDDAMWLISLVENLLSITRMEDGSLKLNIQPELLEDVFSEALAHLDRNAAKYIITTELSDDLLMADMDARLIVQVIINMVNNAVKYTPPGSHITLSARREGQYALVAVSDDGPGIPETSREKLFDMFYTANNQRGDGRRGLGLGLSLCKSIVTAHGGTITAENLVPHGARFSFTLQLSEVSAYE